LWESLERRRLRSLFAGSRLSGAARAWIVAAALPVCSFGVLPIVCEMRRARVQASALIAFLLAAPVFNLWSLIYGITAMPIVGWLTVVAASFTVSVVVGVIAEVWQRRSPDKPADEAGPDSSKLDRWWLDIAVGLVGVGLLAVMLPAGAIEHRVCEASLLNIGWLTAAMVPAWVSPEVNVVHVREVVRIGLLPGAAVPIALLGGGLSLATVSWLYRICGFAVCLRILLALTILVVVAGIAANVGLPSTPRGVPDSHGFDQLTQPYHTARSAVQGLNQLQRGVLESIEVPQAVGIVGLLVMGIVGRYRPTAPQKCAALFRDDGIREKAMLNRPLSRRFIIGAGLTVTTACAVLCLYVYFPTVENTLDDMDLMHTDVFVAVRTRALDEAQYKLAQLELLLDRLPICAALRFRHSPQAGERLARLRIVLEELREALARKEESRSKSLTLASHTRLLACREAYLGR
jgi:uncharacterized membrane protein YraQ (UPF0718 family)